MEITVPPIKFASMAGPLPPYPSLLRAVEIPAALGYALFMGVDSNLYEDLEYRGILKQVTDPALKTALSQEKLTLYAGFDPTSDSLHVGSLLPLLTLKRFQMAGHRVIAVAGGATGMIGDPSGKSAERSLLNDAQIEHNLNGIRSVISRFLDFGAAHPAGVGENGGGF